MVLRSQIIYFQILHDVFVYNLSLILCSFQLGELAPNSITAIELKYVCELPIENNAVKLSIPNTVAPQYSKPPNDCPEKEAADQVICDVCINTQVQVDNVCTYLC